MPTPEVLGRNGTYVVLRKLHTKVAAYRRYLRDRAASREDEVLLGAKMVGRWQSGAPLALAPERDDAELGADPGRAQELHRLGMVNELHAPGDLMPAARRIADKIASNSPTAVQSVKRAVALGEGQPIEQAIAIMMDAHWRSAVHPDRVEGIGAFNDDREPTFDDADF